MKSGPKIPRIVQVSVTDRCQCACAHCGVSFLRGGARRPDPSLRELGRIFADVKAGGCDAVDIFGGEPTLRKDLPEIVALAGDCGLRTILETNGQLLDRPLLSRLKKAGLGMIFLSLDDHTAAVHDANRGVKGLFRAAVAALNLTRELGIPAHVSVVPRDRNYFSSGRMAEFAAFCLRNGAVKVRVLFPSCVGNWSLKASPLFSGEEERAAFLHVPAKLRKDIYVEDIENNPDPRGPSKCPAKSSFCHVTTAGLVLPCPYLPLVFGDIKKESILGIFSRIQAHPCMKENGCSCPTRDDAFLARRMAGVGRERPYAVMRSENLVRVSGGCNNNCRGCPERAARRPAGEILAELARLDKRYSYLEFYGGEPFVRKDIWELLAAAPAGMRLVLHSNARAFCYAEEAARLAKLPVLSVKVPLFSTDPKTYDARAGVKGAFAQAAAGIKNLARSGVPVSVYLPEKEVPADLGPVLRLGAASVSAYSVSREPLPDAVLCFGRRLGSLRLLKLRGGGA